MEGNNRIIVKTMDLRLVHPLCEVNSRPKGKSEERWVEAYLIKRAKKNNWQLEIAGKTCRFLSSQFTFRASPSLEIEGKQHRHVDLLFYDNKEQCLVVLELKKQTDKSKEKIKIKIKKIKKKKKKNAQVIDRIKKR